MPMLALVLACGIAPFGMSSPGMTVDAGHHLALVDADTLRVESEWVGAVRTDRVPLLQPLPASATVEGPGLERDPQGRVTGVYPDGGPVTFVVQIPMAEVRRLDALPLPIAKADGNHRVTFDGALSFRPATTLGFSPHVRRSTTRGVSRDAANDLDLRLGPPAGRSLARYASYDELAPVGGFVGTLQPAREFRRRILLWAGAAFALVVAGLAAAHRRLRRSAEAERADALLAEEIDALRP